MSGCPSRPLTNNRARPSRTPSRSTRGGTGVLPSDFRFRTILDDEVGPVPIADRGFDTTAPAKIGRRVRPSRTRGGGALFTDLVIQLERELSPPIQRDGEKRRHRFGMCTWASEGVAVANARPWPRSRGVAAPTVRRNGAAGVDGACACLTGLARSLCPRWALRDWRQADARQVGNDGATRRTGSSFRGSPKYFRSRGDVSARTSLCHLTVPSRRLVRRRIQLRPQGQRDDWAPTSPAPRRPPQGARRRCRYAARRAYSVVNGRCSTWHSRDGDARAGTGLLSGPYAQLGV